MQKSLHDIGIDESALEQILQVYPELEQSLKSLNAEGLTNLTGATNGDLLGMPSLEDNIRVAITNPENELQGIRYLAQKVVWNLAHHYRVSHRTADRTPALGYRPETQQQGYQNFGVFSQTHFLKFMQDARQTLISVLLQQNLKIQGTDNPHQHNIAMAALSILTTAEWGTWNAYGHIVDSMPVSIVQ